MLKGICLILSMFFLAKSSFVKKDTEKIFDKEAEIKEVVYAIISLIFIITFVVLM